MDKSIIRNFERKLDKNFNKKSEERENIPRKNHHKLKPPLQNEKLRLSRCRTKSDIPVMKTTRTIIT